MFYQVHIITGPGHRSTVLSVDCPTDSYAGMVAARAARRDRSVEVWNGSRRVGGSGQARQGDSGSMASEAEASRRLGGDHNPGPNPNATA